MKIEKRKSYLESSMILISILGQMGISFILEK